MRPAWPAPPSTRTATPAWAFDSFCALTNHTRDHPFFGSMQHADWMRWGYLHADHHLRQFNR
jgi:hypothetical protein